MIQDGGVIAPDRGRFRKKIRKKVVSLLKNKTDAGSRVFPNSSTPSWVEDLPVILIYPRSEPMAKFSEAPRELRRSLDLTVEIIAKGPEVDEEGNAPTDQKSLEDILDDLSEQVTDELANDDSLGNTCDDSILTNIEFEFEGGGGIPIGSAVMTFLVTYNTHYPRNNDKKSLSPFKTNKVEHNIGDDPDTREAEDTVVLPQT